MTANQKNRVIIHEMEHDGDDTLYSLHFEGEAENYGFSDETDYLKDVDAHEIAVEVAEQTNSTVVWEGTKPAWCS